MSRLTDLIAQAKAKDPELGRELEREIKALSSRRAFGLNFERHSPESVELPGCPIRKGYKVRILPPRGSLEKGDHRLWIVSKLKGRGKSREATLEYLSGDVREETTAFAIDLVVVAEIKDYIYPGLVSNGKVERGGDKPYHTVINGENFHALEALTYTHRGKIDVIYIDPPYNTGAKDWKYNNDYVEKEDLYRHSKWLAFMERRLRVAKQLLCSDSSVLIVTIDEKEYLRLGLLLEQLFPDARMQMVSINISTRGTSRSSEFSRVNEFAFFLMFGSSKPTPIIDNTKESTSAVTWQRLRRDENTSARAQGRPNQFFPIFVRDHDAKIVGIGDPVPIGQSRDEVAAPDGCSAVFPIRKDGTEMVWGVTGKSLVKLVSDGFVRVAPPTNDYQPYHLTYIRGVYKNIESGRYKVVGNREDGTVEIEAVGGKSIVPQTVWVSNAHDAGFYGTGVLRAMLPGRRFDFSKSMYAVEDCLRYYLSERPNATVLDFFSGSGTTAHAVMRLNKQDGGRRQCISITNNEVAADEHKTLRQQGLRPGNPEWEKWGICDYITKPRIKAAITGKTPDGNPIQGDYKFTDEFPMADGFEENAEFFTLTYETPVSVSHNRAFGRIAPLLWMKAGSRGKRIDKLPEAGWAVVEAYGLLTNLDKTSEFVKNMNTVSTVRMAFIVTDDERRFQSIVRQLPKGVEPVRLYESYLTNFRFAMGR